jgi:rhamnogalacturonyl hydrolase YesR
MTSLLPILLIASAFTTSSAFAGQPLLRDEVVAQFRQVHPPATWTYDWTTAIFFYGAAQAGVSKPDLRRDFSDVVKLKPTDIDSPDLSAMSLPAVLLLEGAEKAEQIPFLQTIQASKTFFANEPLNEGGVFDHVGRYNRLNPWLPPSSWVIPSSVWIDSSVMYALNGVTIASYEQDQKRLSFFTEQLRRIHKLLWDPRAELYKHAYYFATKSFAPTDGFWARGNLWMTVALLETSQKVSGPEKKEFEDLFRQHITSLRRRADLQNGLKTMMDYDAPTNTFETSASALYAYALMKGSRLGILPASYGVDGKTLARNLVSRNLKQVAPGRVSVQGISCPTTAMSWPWYYTRVVGTCPDESYGVGAVLMMFSELP